MAVGTYFAALDILVDWILMEQVLGTRLVAEIHGAKILSRVVNGTAQQREFTVKAE